MNETKSAPVYCGNGKEHKFEDGANEYGKTHYVKINDFKPEAKSEDKTEEPLPF